MELGFRLGVRVRKDWSEGSGWLPLTCGSASLYRRGATQLTLSRMLVSTRGAYLKLGVRVRVRIQE